ncbi:dienelactone hydrolase family protein [Microlunatus parietis]|uniref:Dienelactone hydrolase n=1 Tax=Microlunatus parietis TaxID=682979 RepID=A0A7Y9I976_9ACTN|nr:alpha/beta fold hydrolase [Microlunatus parietis]NYE72415.1 dienelactone hydrolase [Microlunatus parietis]
MRVDEPGADPALSVLDRSLDRDAVSAEQRLAYLRDLTAPFLRMRTDADAKIIEEVPCDGYRRDRIEVELLAGMRLRAYVLIPDGAPARAPAVLAVHGHGYGSRQITGLLPDGTPDPDDLDGHHHFAVALARRGLLVIAPDVVGFGERRSRSDRSYDADAGNACYRLASTLLMQGATLTGLRVTELLGVLDQLVAREDVDPHRIGIVGHSGGSMLSMIVAALDERVRASVLCGYPNTFADSIRSVRHCLCNYLPGVLALAEQPDLLELIMPRRLYLESGERDPIFPRGGFERAAAQVADAYAAAGVADRFGTDLHPGGHEVSGWQSFAWLERALA